MNFLESNLSSLLLCLFYLTLTISVKSCSSSTRNWPTNWLRKICVWCILKRKYVNAMYCKFIKYSSCLGKSLYKTIQSIDQVCKLICKVWSVDLVNDLGFSLYTALILVAWSQSQRIKIGFKILNTDKDLSMFLLILKLL